MPKPYAIVEDRLTVDEATWRAAREATDSRSGADGPAGRPSPGIGGYYDRVSEAQAGLESSADWAARDPAALVVVGDGVLVVVRQDLAARTTSVSVVAVVKTGGEERLDAAPITLQEALTSAPRLRVVERQPSTVAFPTLFHQSLPPAPLLEEEDEDALRAAMTEVETGQYWPRRLTFRPGAIHDNSTPRTSPPAIEEDEE